MPQSQPSSSSVSKTPWSVRERFVPCSAGRLFVAEAGATDQPGILFVHGYPDTHQVWLPVMGELSAGFHVCAYDVRGAGRSSRPDDVAAYRMEHLADDAYAVADAVFGDKPFYLVGHDWGGLQSWETVSREDAEQRILGYLTMSGPCLDHVAQWARENTRTPRGLLRIAAQSLRSLYVPVLATPGAARLAWSLVLARAWRLRRPVEERARFETLEQDGHYGAKLYEANMLQRLLKPREVTTAVPVRLIGLNRDPYVAVALMKTSVQHLPHASYEEWNDDHWSAFSDPVRVAHCVSRWIADREALAASSVGAE